MMPTHRANLRKQLRSKRNALSLSEQQLSAHRATKNVHSSGLLRRHRHIAFYLANDGEISPMALLTAAHQKNRHCYLPVISPLNTLWFVRYKPGDKLKKNRFGINEPAKRFPRQKAWALNLVFVPLVGFDRQGGRLGMGGGYYDRSFKRARMSGPRLIGLAHYCQELASIDLQPWDVKLSGIVTDREVISANQERMD